MDLSSRSSRDLSFPSAPPMSQEPTKPQILYEGCSDSSGIKSLIDSTIESMFTNQFSKPNEFTLKRLRYDYEYKSRSVKQSSSSDEEPSSKRELKEGKHETATSVAEVNKCDIKKNVEKKTETEGAKKDIINFKKKWIKQLEERQLEEKNEEDSPSECDSDDEIKPFLCGVCNSRFRHLSAFTKHKLIHSPQQSFSCEECDFTCKQSGQMASHKLVHSGAKLLACSQCSYTCKRASNMKTHKMTHEGKKSLACTQCDLTFTHPSHLKKHASVHSSEKLYACSECSFTCKLAGLLKTHQLTHGEIK